MAVINPPPYLEATRTIFTWFTQVFVICFSIQESGTTAERPTKSLWIGRRYYDRTLNKPVYVSSVNPTVWRDASSAVV